MLPKNSPIPFDISFPYVSQVLFRVPVKSVQIVPTIVLICVKTLFIFSISPVRLSTICGVASASPCSRSAGIVPAK